MEKQIFREGLLSVVVPVYKVEAYLDRCVESIVNQTYTNLEIILVDDGSPDNCPQLCDEWAARDSRIKVIHKENGGLSDARNKGIAAATGEYLAFVDSDDYIDHCMYETMFEAMGRTNAGIACCGRYVVKGNSKIPMHYMTEESLFTSKEAIRELLIGGSIEEATWDKLYRAELFDGIYFPLGEINEDIVIMPTLLRRAEKIVHVGRPFYYYWQNSTSITRSAYSENKRIMLDHLDAIKEYLEEMYPELICYFDVLQSRYCQSALYLLLDNESTYREFHDDYLAFYRRFQKSFKNMLKLVSISREEKIKGYLIYYRAYYWMHLLKSRMKK